MTPSIQVTTPLGTTFPQTAKDDRQVQVTPQAPAPASTIADPNTICGQIPGAIIVIKHKPWGYEQFSTLRFQVGDYVEILEDQEAVHPDLMNVKNLRTGMDGSILWVAVFEVSTRQACDCHGKWNAQCRCVYEDFEKSVVSWHLIGVGSWRLT